MEEEISSDSLATSEEYEIVSSGAEPQLSIAGDGSVDQLRSSLSEVLKEGSTSGDPSRPAAMEEGKPSSSPCEAGPEAPPEPSIVLMGVPSGDGTPSDGSDNGCLKRVIPAPNDSSGTHSEDEVQGGTGGSVAFTSVVYLGCAAINAPRSEMEIQRNMAILNDQATSQDNIRVTLLVPPDSEGTVLVYESSTNSEVASFPIHRILFCARGSQGSPEQNCFAFTCSHGATPESAIFQCHVFRCPAGPDAVLRVLQSFAAAFRRVPRVPGSASVASSRSGSVSSVGTCVRNNERVHTFEATLDVREEDQKGNFSPCARDKDYFKFRCNLEKVVQVTVQQAVSSKEMSIERCFGMLISPGRHVKHSDMQVVEMVSMAKSSSGTEPTVYQITGRWNPMNPLFEVLNSETSRDTRVYLTVAVDLVVCGVREPLRFVFETKAKIFPQGERFWYFNKKPFQEQFYVRLREVDPEQATGEHRLDVVGINSASQIQRKAALSLALDTNSTRMQSSGTMDPSPAQDPTDPESDGDEPLLSGTGEVSKDCPEALLEDWAQALQRWRQLSEQHSASSGGSQSTTQTRPKQVSVLVRRSGIPEALRGEVWQLLAGVVHDGVDPYLEAYRVLLSRECPCESVIQRDINRTFPAHEFFRESGGAGQDSLYKICKAYAAQDPEVGYCQGLSFLAAALLLHMPEEQAFGVFCKIMGEYGLRDLFRNSFEFLHLKLFQLERLVEDQLPELFAHFMDLHVEAHMFGSQWFLTLFTAKFPLHVVFFILDFFLLDGMDTIFQVAMALLTLSMRDLLALDFEGVLKHFRVAIPKKYRSEEMALTLLRTAVGIKVKKLKKYEKEYYQQKEQEKLTEDPIETLNKDKRRLMESNQRLEQENDELAYELVNSKIQLRKDLDSAEDRAETLSKELQGARTSLTELEEEKRRLETEVGQLKEMCRRELQHAEQEIKRNSTIISEYKQICSQLSLQVEKEQRRARESLMVVRQAVGTCEHCAPLLLNEGDGINTKVSSASLPVRDEKKPQWDEGDRSSVDRETQVRELELELAQTKLALVESECKNQDLTHQLNAMVAELQSSKNTWLHKTLSSIREVGRKDSVPKDMTA
uniref:Putative rab gtpase-activating protein 1 n=1 Tax=Ornithodoros turicata TaxID=34597 RepID=A0A2R5LGU6_9ACAR